MQINYSDSELLISAGDIRQFPSILLPQAVFSGRSNVGKSSLINTILGRKSLARVSSSPGKTVTVNFYRVDGKFVLVDLPGYGYAKRPAADKARWSALTDGFFTKNKNSDLIKTVFQLVDLEVGPTEDDIMMLDFLNRSGLNFAVLATKADTPSKTSRCEALLRLGSCGAIPEGVPVIPCSAKTGEGKEEIRRLLLQSLGSR